MQAIATRRDPIHRNFEITQSYHRITRAVARRLGGLDAPWTGFAVWASRTAGEFIRGEWLPAEARAMSARHEPLRQAIAAIEARVRDHVAEGNRLVYAEIAPRFVELIDILAAPAGRRRELAAETIMTYRAGPVDQGGQDMLAQALLAYVDAAACDDDERRAELVLLANLLVGYHEQRRLQVEIQGALDAAWTPIPELRAGWGRALQRRLAARVRQALTRLLMRTRLPGVVLKVGEDVPPLADGRMFPPALERAALPELRALLAEIDRTPDTTRGSRARDWADFGDRMNYVADMFRSRQRDPGLLRPPFTAPQIAGLRRGVLPTTPA
ncbi:MAG: hypothetical protein KC636_28330 [Myxococcales bacterium]|nr:hypothetical protein [Myxococcales bacterium]